MRARGAAIQGSLAAVGLIAAYTTWQREPESAPGSVMVIDAGKNDITKIRFEADGKWSELEPKNEPEGRVVWVRLSGKADAKPVPTPERTVRGSEAALKLVERFSPLRATRALGSLSPEKLKELGLDAPKKSIEVTVKGQAIKLQVGTSPYGVSDPYVKDERDGKVYVLASGMVSELESAGTRLLDRMLHGFKSQEFDGVIVTAADKKRELVQQSPEKPAETKLASKKSGKPDELAKNWHDKVWRLVVVDVLGKGELPPGGEPKPGLRVEYTSKGKSIGFVELARVAAPAPANSSAPAPAAEIYARTEHTAGWVKVVASADELLKEAEKVVAGE